jgi:hypothetical protein
MISLVICKDIEMILLVICRDMEMVFGMLQTNIEMVLGMRCPGIEMFLAGRSPHSHLQFVHFVVSTLCKSPSSKKDLSFQLRTLLLSLLFSRAFPFKKELSGAIALQ